MPSCCSLGTATNYPSVPVRRSSSDGGGAGVKSGILLTHGSRSSSSSSLMPVNVLSHITRFSTTTSTGSDVFERPVEASRYSCECGSACGEDRCAPAGVNNLPRVLTGDTQSTCASLTVRCHNNAASIRRTGRTVTLQSDACRYVLSMTTVQGRIKTKFFGPDVAAVASCRLR